MPNKTTPFSAADLGLFALTVDKTALPAVPATGCMAPQEGV
jgi:hypothetical protein